MERIDACLDGVKSVGIAGHINPDGDCIGSSLAVYNYIAENYPDIKVFVYLDKVPNLFKFLKNARRIKSALSKEREHDLFFALDCADLGRLGEAKKFYDAAKKTVCVDHHISNAGFADERYIVPQASSTSELVYNIMDPEKISKGIAECLYVGIVHDTGLFQYSCTSSRTMEIAGALMDMGIDYSRIVDRTFFQKTFEQQKILGVALSKAKLSHGGRIISCIITNEDMKACSVAPRHLEGIVSQLRSTKGVDTAIFLYQNAEDGYKISMRSERIADVSAVASLYGGGGHVRAAGCTVKGIEPDVFMEEVIERVGEYFGDESV